IRNRIIRLAIICWELVNNGCLRVLLPSKMFKFRYSCEIELVGKINRSNSLKPFFFQSFKFEIYLSIWEAPVNIIEIFIYTTCKSNITCSNTVSYVRVVGIKSHVYIGMRNHLAEHI